MNMYTDGLEATPIRCSYHIVCNLIWRTRL